MAQVKVFVDSGAVGNFVDTALASRLGLPIEVLSHPIPVSVILGCRLVPSSFNEADILSIYRSLSLKCQTYS